MQLQSSREDLDKILDIVSSLKGHESKADLSHYLKTPDYAQKSQSFYDNRNERGADILECDCDWVDCTVDCRSDCDPLP